MAHVVAVSYVDYGERGRFGADEVGELFAGDAGEGGDGVRGHGEVVLSSSLVNVNIISSVARSKSLLECVAVMSASAYGDCRARVDILRRSFQVSVTK